MVDVVMPSAAPRTQPTKTRAVVSWEGPGQPIMLVVYGPDRQVAVRINAHARLGAGQGVADGRCGGDQSGLARLGAMGG